MQFESGIAMSGMSRGLSLCLIAVLAIGPVFHAHGRPSDNAYAKRLLRRAIEAVGLEKARGKVLHYFAAESHLQRMQSDRMYPPFYSLSLSHECWFDVRTSVERTSTSFTYFGRGPEPSSISLVGLQSAVVLRDSVAVPSGLRTNKLNIWAVLQEWQNEKKLRFGGVSQFRDFPREVIVRASEEGEQRLFIDPKTGFPVKLEILEPHFLWGQVRVEYVYSTWIQMDDVFIPSGSFKMADGETEISRTLGRVELINGLMAPDLVLPPAGGSRPPQLDMNSLRSPNPDTVRVESKLVLLSNRFYTEAVALISDTIFVFDATMGEERARQDEAWIQRLFPGEHPVVVVVSDVAWPHIGGLRYWVSKGAVIVAHEMNVAFLREVIERVWVLKPDALERDRPRGGMKFIAVDSSHFLAGGLVQVYAINGIGSEGSLMSFLPAEKFLWAGDCIQNISRPTAYASEVWHAVKRVGIVPERTAAQHIPITPWNTFDSMYDTPKQQECDQQQIP